MAASCCTELGRRTLLGLASISLLGSAGCVVREGAEPQPFVPGPDKTNEEANRGFKDGSAHLRAQA